MTYYVEATYRENDCDRNSPITKLHLNKILDGFYGHQVKNLKPIADAGRLVVKTGPFCTGVKVKIYYSYAYSRWIASTVADSRECNNLLSLPVYSSLYRGNNNTYSVCRI